MKKYYLPVVAVAILAIIMASSFAMGASSSTPNADPSADSRCATVSGTGATPIYKSFDFAANGSCAIYFVTVTGSGLLQVDTADVNPAMYPDYWRATITVMYAGTTGPYLSKTVSTGVSLATAPPTYTGVAEMPVYGGLYIKVIITWDRGATWKTTLFPAGCYIRFRYTGTSMTVTGPLPSS